MSSDVDLRELAIDRGGAAGSPITARRHLLTRYVLPLALLLGFIALVAWAARDLVFPPQEVIVMPVYSTRAELRREGTPLFNAAGWVEPRPTPVRVAALAPGVIEDLRVVEDQAVQAGEPVAVLVSDDAQLAHEMALANLKLREAEVAEAEAALAAAEIRLNQPVHLVAPLGEADAALAKIDTQLGNLPFETRRAEADHEAAQKDYEGKLAAKSVVRGVEVDIARSKAEAAKAKVEELRNRVMTLASEKEALEKRRDALKTQLELLTDETKAKEEAAARVNAAAARAKQARVAIAEAELRLDRMTVTSPIAGRIYQLVAHPGARIGSGMTHMVGHDGSTVVTLYRPDMLQARVDVRFEDLPDVSENQSVEINNPALKAPLRGRVLFRSSEADIQKNTLQVKVEILDPPAVFKPEMLVDVTFLAPRRQSPSEPSEELRLYVMRQLIQRDDAGSFVWIADQSRGVARKTQVEVGAAGPNGLVEVIGGLTIASRIIVSGFERLADGDRIRISSEDTTLGANSIPKPDDAARESP